MRSHAKAPSAGSTQRQATGLGRILRGAFATRGAALDAGGSGASSHGYAANVCLPRPLLGALPRPLLAALVTVFITLALGTPHASAAMTPIFDFGASGTQGGRFNATGGARGIAINETGNGGVPVGTIYVADNGNRRIQRFLPDDNGTPIDSSDDSVDFVSAWGWDVIALGAAGDTGTGFEICTVAADCQAGAAGAGAGQFATNSATGGIAVDQSTGNVYVTDRTSFRVQQFSATGNFIRTWGADVDTGGGAGFEICEVPANCKAGVSGGAAGAFSFPSAGIVGIAADKDGNVYVADSGRVQKFGPGGVFLATAGWNVDSVNPSTEYEVCTVAANCKAGVTGTGADQFGTNLPTFIAVDEDGDVYAVGRTDGPIYRLTSALAFGEAYPSTTGTGTNPNRNSLAVDWDTGHVFFGQAGVAAGKSTSTVFELDPSTGLIVAQHTGDASYTPVADGDQWVGLAFDSVSDRMYGTRTTSATFVRVFQEGPPTVTNAGATGNSGTRATLNGTVNPNGIAVGECFFEWGTTTAYGQMAPCDPSAASLGSGSSPVAVEADITGLVPNGAQYHFRLVAGNAKGTAKSANQSFTTPNTVITGSATAVTTSSATLNGAVNPDTVPISECVFEYGTSTAYGRTAPCAESPASIGTGTSSVPVHADISVHPGTIYHFRLKAVYGNGIGPVFGSNVTLQTPGPLITATWSEDVVMAEAFLKAEINPVGFATTYHFEYGPTTAYGQQTPELPVGSDSNNHEVGRFIEGLEPGTTYHYRVVATNADAVNEGPDRTFATFSPLVTETDCSNQAFRVGPSANLPDCRAYEMVSPLDKNGGDIETAEQEAGFNKISSAYRQASLHGGKITYSTATAFGDAIAGHWSNQYISSRGPDGWSTHAISARRGRVVDNGTLRWFALSFFQGFTPDLSRAWVRDNNVDPLTPDALHGYANLYRRDNDADSYGALTTQGPFGPNANANLGQDTGANQGGPRVVGYSSDLNHQVFTADAALTPDASEGGPGNGFGGDFVQGTNTQLYDRLEEPTDALQRLTVRAAAGTYTLSAEAVRALGTFTSGTPSVTEVKVGGIGREFEVGDTVTGFAIPAGTTVTAVGAETLTLSQNATASGPRTIIATETTDPLSATAGAAAVQSALEELEAIGAGNVTVSGGPGDATGSSPYEIAFGGELAGEPVFALRTADLGLSGGSPASSATVAIADPGGSIHLISVLPNGQASTNEAFAGTASVENFLYTRDQMLKNAISDDGSRIFWTNSSGDGPGTIYMRENPGEAQSAFNGAGECTEPDKACTIRVSESVSSSPAQYWAAAADGSKVLFSQGNFPNRTLYLFDVDTGTPTQIAGQSLAVSATAEDLSHIYFVSGEAKAPGAVAGQLNLYDYHGGDYSLVGVVSDDDVSSKAQNISGNSIRMANLIGTYSTAGNPPSPILNQTRVSPDGRHFAFMSNSAALSEAAGYDNTDVVTGKPDFEVFRYDAEAEQVSCASCNPSGARPRGSLVEAPYSPLELRFTDFPDLRMGASIPTHEHDNYASRILSDDGNRLFFHSDQALLPRDTNGVQDVYLWQAPGTGECEVGDSDYFPQNDGCIYLISTGRDDAKSEFVDATPDGSEVYVSVDESLDPRDPGLRDIYVAKIGGGYPLPSEDALCEGEACQSPPAPPDDPTPNSLSFQGPGNPVAQGDKPKARRCPKGKRRVKARGGKTRCVKRKRSAKRVKSKRAKRANNDRRASR